MLLLTFNHSHDAMHAETVIDRHSIKGRLIPTPERISAQCGLTLKLPEADIEVIQQLMQAESIQPSGYYGVDNSGTYTTLSES